MQDNDPCRMAFEEANLVYSAARGVDGNYVSRDTQFAWLGWRAAWKCPPEEEVAYLQAKKEAAREAERLRKEKELEKRKKVELDDEGADMLRRFEEEFETYDADDAYYVEIWMERSFGYAWNYQGKKVKELVEALAFLLDDSQHVNHGCGDDAENCPVLNARQVVEKYKHKIRENKNDAQTKA